MRREDMSLNFDGCFLWLNGWRQFPTQRNWAMAWVDYRKAYHMVPHSWVEEFLEMFGIAVNVKQFLLSNMKKWRLNWHHVGNDWGLLTIQYRYISVKQPLTNIFSIPLLFQFLFLQGNHSGHGFTLGSHSVWRGRWKDCTVHGSCSGRTCKAVRKHSNRLPKHNEFNVDDRCQLSIWITVLWKAVITIWWNDSV